jgi:hypothetical protein
MYDTLVTTGFIETHPIPTTTALKRGAWSAITQLIITVIPMNHGTILS